ncbi:MAG: hypothetical protein K1X81_00495 [Bacteroidia bacterium]|nr:hypothetical protein [Bacteroidia bacterium]
MKAKMISTVAGFLRMPGYAKVALVLLVLAAASSITSCCPPGGGPIDDPWGDTTRVK